MTCAELLQECEARNRELLERGKAAAARLDDEAWNEAPKDGWSPAQIFEHMMLANGPYAALLERLLEDAPAGAEAPAKHSFFGKLLLKAAGPRGNAPAPKALHPCAGPHGRDVLDRWAAQQERIVELHEMARGKNLAQLRFSNPFVKFFKMTGCDAFALFADHTERHVSQIESRVPGL
jgi:hypothetical protein